MRQFLITAVMLLMLPGCLPQPVSVRALPEPEPEQPSANLPAKLHQRNWTGSRGQGSCVHASLVNHLRWLNQYEPTATVNGTLALEIVLMRPALITATPSKRIQGSWTGRATPGVERSSGGNRPTAARLPDGSTGMANSMRRFSTTTIPVALS